jgi:hypothetical protein
MEQGGVVVAIDVETPGSPGWWLRRLFWMLGNQKRQQRLARLRSYRLGDPPAPSGRKAPARRTRLSSRRPGSTWRIW